MRDRSGTCLRSRGIEACNAARFESTGTLKSAMTNTMTSTMRKIPVIAIATVAMIFAASQNGLTPIYAATAHNESAAATPSGDKVYQQHCAICHGEKLEGNPPSFPPLTGISRQLDPQQEEEIIHHGKGRMPAFPKLQNVELSSLLHLLNSGQMLAAGDAHASDSHPSSSLLVTGSSIFQQNCAFCHGRDAGGGESGPDLTRSKLVAADRGGDMISDVVLNGRTAGEKKMPAFKFSESEIASVAAFIHDQRKKSMSRPGGRAGVDVADLQTGNVDAGKQYFQGPGGCSLCHSPTGDLAHIAARYEGLQLEEQMLYPRNAKSTVTVTLAPGKTATGTVAYLDEFTVGLVDDTGTYRSWPTATVKYSVHSPVDAHVAQFPKYTDADVHNLMAYLQTLR